MSMTGISAVFAIMFIRLRGVVEKESRWWRRDRSQVEPDIDELLGAEVAPKKQTSNLMKMVCYSANI